MSAARKPGTRKRGGPVIAIILVVILVAAVVAADFAARTIARQVIGDKLRVALSLEADAPLEVDVRGFSTLVQLLRGELTHVDVSADSVPLGDLTGAAEVTALGVPLDQSQPVDRLSVEVAFDEAELEKLSSNLSGMPITSVGIEGGEIRIASEFQVIWAPIPVEIGVVPEAVEGQLEFTPTSIALGGASTTVEELRQLFGDAAGSLLQTQSLCVAEFLPLDFELESVEIRGSSLVLSLGAEDAVLNDDALSTRGTCA